ncbi:MAG: M55 family metallopeptidase [Pseudomonadota bacterium]
MHVYICADIEGVAGVVSPAQTVQKGFEYEQARVWMTDEVIAACEGAFAAGAQHVTVSDSHGNGQNLLLDRLPASVRVVRNWPRPLGMMQGVEQDDVSAAILLGHHTGAHHRDGVLAHTISGLLIAEVRVNGKPMSETQLNAALAAHFSVPVVLATGDEDYCQHVAEALGTEVHTVATKSATGRYSANTLTPAASCNAIRQVAETALQASPPVVSPVERGPLRLEVQFQRHLPAELLAFLPGFEHLHSTVVASELPDMPSLTRVLNFISAVRFDEQIP